VRLASSLIQAIVNEMYYRVPASKVDWETEDIKKFEYGSEKIVINTKVRFLYFPLSAILCFSMPNL